MGNYRKQVDLIPQQAMTSKAGTKTDSGEYKPAAHQTPSLSEDDLVEVQREGSDSGDEDSTPEPESKAEPQSKPEPEERKTTKPGEPAYVAPIPKIGSISPISPMSQPLDMPPARPPLPKFVGSFLVGRTVDEAGDIVDEGTGQVLARVAGDLPSIAGRKVSNNKGDILGDDGELLGWVADLAIERKGSNTGSGSPSSPRMPGWPAMRGLADTMGRTSPSLMVDHLGNILDANGSVVGKFHDNNNPTHRKEREEQQRAREAVEKAAMQAAADRAVRKAVAAQEVEKRAEAGGDGEGASEPKAAAAAEGSAAEGDETEHEPECTCNCGTKKPRLTEEERRQNAQAWRKENPAESPSDIFLDVKSTTEGIQLTIRIPTVFNGSQVRPTVQFT